MKKILTFALLFVPAMASAQTANWGIDELASGGTALGTKDLRTQISGVINIVLGFLGVLTTVGILWGGFTMMTSYGNAEKNAKGKGAAVAGLIGLVIILTAYAISRFVLTNVENVTV